MMDSYLGNKYVDISSLNIHFTFSYHNNWILINWLP